ncbi:MAG: hypothetical protein IT315_09485 [Anaerolineales bacterium]|nr:hypothetical protein [Anaerolineales bacterium]
MSRIISILLLAFMIFVSACASPAVAPTQTAFPVTSTLTPSPIPTETLVPTPEPTANPETAYYQSLTDEQKALFDQTKDMTAEGFNRMFLTEQGLTNYLAYYDKSGEVAYVWNFEQGKLNPALKIENNLLINETSASHIIWNPELNRAEAQKTLADYFRYARARVIAGANHVQLGNTLESALANPVTQKYLEEGRNVTLLPTSRDYINIDGSKAKFKVPAQNIFVSGETPIVFRTVQELDENMVVTSGASEGQRILTGYSFETNSDGTLIINYYHVGPEDLANFSEHSDFVLSRRIKNAVSGMFGRASQALFSGGYDDPVTQSIIFDPYGLKPDDPLIKYSQTR